MEVAEPEEADDSLIAGPEEADDSLGSRSKVLLTVTRFKLKILLYKLSQKFKLNCIYVN